MLLKEQIKTILLDGINMSIGYSELERFRAQMQEMQDNLQEPLRIAVVGLIKAGKSTLLNSLMNEKMLITDLNEATYNVTWFKYSEKPGLTIQLKNGEKKIDSLENLDFWTARSKKDENPLMDNVEYINIGYPNEILKQLEIIDTPGLGSKYGTDSSNTSSFTAIEDGNEDSKATRLTERETSKADAIIYAFRRNAKETDAGFLESFQAQFSNNQGPINTFGVLTQCDRYWGNDDEIEDPIEIGYRITKRYMDLQRIKRVLYTILPVIGIMGEGACQLDKYFDMLLKLSTVEPPLFKARLSNGIVFCERELNGFPLGVPERKALYDAFGPYGIYIAVNAIREGSDISKVKKILIEKAGIDKLISTIYRHFGNRSSVIKAGLILGRLQNLCTNMPNEVTKNKDEVKRICDYIYGRCDEILSKEHVFRELDVVKMYYEGGLRLKEEDANDLLCITGENGYNCEARLRVKEGTSICELKKIAREKLVKWNERSSMPTLRKNEEIAALVLARSCELMYFHLDSLSGI
jgi:GTPase SAR1 family protein